MLKINIRIIDIHIANGFQEPKGEGCKPVTLGAVFLARKL